MGTTELMANLTDLNPKTSAFDETAVFMDRIDTNTAEIIDILFVITDLIVLTSADRFNSLFIEEHNPNDMKQLVVGKKTKFDTAPKNCDKARSIVFTENDV